MTVDSVHLIDLFLKFADIVGFTAWSSVRDPCQVFTLLETVYQAFDEIAKRRRVFKVHTIFFNCKLYCSGVVILATTVFAHIFQVETIGDCYVAVAGLPDPRPDHAVVMARFAQECLIKMNVMTKQLETTLGPGTRTLLLETSIQSLRETLKFHLFHRHW
jgi:class 3 adenylate cyclase